MRRNFINDLYGTLQTLLFRLFGIDFLLKILTSIVFFFGRFVTCLLYHMGKELGVRIFSVQIQGFLVDFLLITLNSHRCFANHFILNCSREAVEQRMVDTALFFVNHFRVINVKSDWIVGTRVRKVVVIRILRVCMERFGVQLLSHCTIDHNLKAAVHFANIVEVFVE
jgi:hypothetical protein